jgi:hypothetical protein
MTNSPATASNSDRQWYIVGRWQEYEGESRANLLRIVAIGAFYLVQLVQFYGFSTRNAADTLFHQRATGLAVAWTMVALAVLVCLRQRIFPAALKYCSTACDLALLTAVAALAAGPHSPLVLAYFLIIVLAALRFSLGLVWFTTLGAMAAYWLLVGIEDAKSSRWFDGQHAVPPVEQLLTLLSLGMTGIVCGQVVRRVRGIARQYAERIASLPSHSPSPSGSPRPSPSTSH